MTVHAPSKIVDHQRVMEFIQPFIASHDYGELRKPQVRLTHQSVKGWMRELPLESGRESKKPDETGHDCKNPGNFMFNICIKYLLFFRLRSPRLSQRRSAF
jgi:hypothetical protein